MIELIQEGYLWAIRRPKRKWWGKPENEYYLLTDGLRGWWFTKDAACYMTDCWSADKDRVESIYRRLVN